MFVTVLSLASLAIAAAMVLRSATSASATSPGETGVGADAHTAGAGLQQADLPLGIAIAAGGLVVLLYQAALLPLGPG
jgi:hypothetical protein